MTAPIASGWSGCRVGLAPTGKRRLCTAHTRNGRQADGLRGLSILVCHLPKSAKQMLIVKLANLEIGSAAERYRTSMAKYLPKPLRTLYRGGRAWAVNGVTSSNAAAVSEIKRQCHEKSDFGHTLALYKFTSRTLREASP